MLIGFGKWGKYLVLPQVQVTFIYLFIYGHACMSCRILVPPPGIEPVPPAVEVLSPNHWTAREFPQGPFFFPFFFFLWLSQVLVAAHGIFVEACRIFSLWHAVWVSL